MIVIDLPEGWGELAAKCAAQTVVLDAARRVAEAAEEYLAVVDSFGKVNGVEYLSKYMPANERLRDALKDYREIVEPVHVEGEAGE